jgi:hypothetical protein
MQLKTLISLALAGTVSAQSITDVLAANSATLSTLTSKYASTDFLVRFMIVTDI